MKDLRQRQIVFALLALLLVFAGCKGESPTAPPIGGPGPGTPPSGASVAITVGNPNPQANSATPVTATVTVNGQPAPAGTAVEFGTSLGRFESTGTASALTVTNAQGQATVSLTSSAAGTAVVTVVVNNVVQRATVVFSAAPTQPPPTTPTAATITGFSPQIGRVTGGELVTITGTNFREPVRVFFQVDGDLREGQVVSVTPTQIQVLTPTIDIAAGQTLEAPIVVFVEQGTPNEQRVTSTSPFTFRRVQLTPEVSGISPPSGPLEGGTQTTIFGDGFEPMVQVFFGLAEVQIVNVTFNAIVVISPNSRDTTVDAVPVAGQVPIRIRNIQSNTETTFAQGFRYVSAMQIVAVGPTEGPFTGGTRVTIDGVGFDDPVAVTIGGIAAQPIQVSGTKIIAVTNAIAVESCADQGGPIAVTNISTGASAESSIEFTYRVPQPIIISASSPVQPGGTITVRVAGAFGFPRLRLGDRVLNITSEVVNPDGTTTFTAVVPTNLTLTTQVCPGAGQITAPQPTSFSITYESATTGCTDTLNNGVVVEPVPTPRISFNPISFTPFNATINPGDPAAVPPVPPSTTPSAVQTVNLVNSGAAPLDVTSITDNCAAANFTVTYPPAPFTLNVCEIAPISARYDGTVVPGTQSCQVTITSNAGPARVINLTGTSQ